MKSVLVTGASGFVGRAVCARFAADGWNVEGSNRSDTVVKGCTRVWNHALTADTDWREALTGKDAVVHLAARVHVMHEVDTDPLSAFRAVNVEGTRVLAEQAATAGVRCFVFVSSIKVNGEATEPGKPFTAHSEPAPVDPYGQSKWEAEQALHDIAARTGLEVVILRPPLVYGPGVKGNMAGLIRLCRKGIPLPLGGIRNQRSLIALGNLVEAITLATTHPDATGQTFLLRDGEDLSTPELVRRIAKAMDRSARLLPIPAELLALAARLTGQTKAAQRLLGNLQIDDQLIRDRLGFHPATTVDEELVRTVRF